MASFLETRPIVLIGGAPTTGKSTLASRLSKHLGLPWGSTDQFREIMKYIGDPKKAPMVFDSSNHTAESYHEAYTAQDIINNDTQQSIEMWPYLKDFLKTDYSWTEGFILEGVNILPQIIANDLPNLKNIKALFIIDEDMKRARDVIYSRGIWYAADTYPDHVKEKELLWVELATRLMKEDCKKHNLPCLSIEKSENDLARALALLGL